MNKCWFVLEQSFYTPPVYAKPSRAGGVTTSGGLRLGDVVPSARTLYPILTLGTLPVFGRAMRIDSVTLGNFNWGRSRESEKGGGAAAGAPVAAAAGLTVGGQVRLKFQQSMSAWAEFGTLDQEVVQASTDYVDDVLMMPDVQREIERQKLRRVNQWTVYVVIGLMIARKGGSVGSSTSRTQELGAGAEVDAPGVANASIDMDYKNTDETFKSGEIEGDRVWAVRLAKVHKGRFCRRWTQTEEADGAALDGEEDEADEDVAEVLTLEGVGDFDILECAAGEDEEEKLSFVTMAANA